MIVLVTGGNGQLAQCINDVRISYPNIDFVFTDVDDLDITNQEQLNLFFQSNTLFFNNGYNNISSLNYTTCKRNPSNPNLQIWIGKGRDDSHDIHYHLS